MLDGLLTNTAVWLLVFARMGGMLGMNPVFSRRNVPAGVRAGMTFLFTALVAPGASAAAVTGSGSLDLAMALLRELFVGLACGFVFQVYYYMLFFAGDWMDMHFGMSMAKVFDPGTSIQASMSGNLFNTMFLLYFFATDSHLLLIRIFIDSFRILPVGAVTLTAETPEFFLELFIAAFSMVLRLALPFVAAEVALEVTIGVLMKLIPQIHVFVINMQMKVMLGFVLLLAFSGPIASFLDNYMRVMLENMQWAFSAMGA